jgi:FG-GAP-like repeat
VTNAHPAKTYTVTVKTFSSGGASTTKAFMLTVATPATCTPVHFAAATNVPAGNGPYAFAVGDFNGDGKQDLAVTNVTTNSVSILLGNGNGGFSAPTTFPVGNNPGSIAVGDFNGDGKQDLAVANLGSNNVGIFIGNGDGNFTPAVDVPVGIIPIP